MKRYAAFPGIWMAASGVAFTVMGPGMVSFGVAATGALAAAAGALAWLDARASRRDAEVRRAAGRFRFLCSTCLCFGPFTYGCGHCGGEVESFVVHTGGLYFQDCNYCRKPVFPKAGSAEAYELSARCAWCGDRADLRRHERAVRVLATLHPQDFDLIGKRVPHAVPLPGPPRLLCRDDGRELTCLMDLRMPQPELENLPQAHAARQVDAVWLDPARFEPLAFGRALDGLLRYTGPGAGRRSPVSLFLAREMEDPGLKRLLEQRFQRWETLADPASLFLREEASPD